MTDIEEMAKACFDREEWECVEDGQIEPEKWDDIDETAKEYWREFVKPLLSFIRAAELRGRVAGMREAKTVVRKHFDELLLGTKQLDDELAIWEALDEAATKLESPNPTE